MGSLRTVTAGCGSLLFSAAFSLSISMERPKIAGLPFFVASCMYILSYIQTKSFLNHHETSKCDSERNNQTTTSLLDATNHRLNNVSNMIFGHTPTTRTTEESLNLLNSSHGINVTNEICSSIDRGNNADISTISPPSLYQAKYPEDNDVFAMSISPTSSSLPPHKQVQQLVPHSFHQINLSIPSKNTEIGGDDPSFGYSVLGEGDTTSVRVAQS